MDDSLLVRGFQRLGDLLRDRQRLVERDRRLERCGPPVSAPSTSSITSARISAASSRPCICAMLGWLSDARVWASRLKRASRSASWAHFREQHLDRDVAMQPRVVRAIDLAHPPTADQVEDVVRSEAGAGGKAHGASRGGAASRF